MTDTTLHALPAAASDELESPARRALRRLFKRKGAVVGLVVIAIFVLLALFAPLISPYEPIATSWSLVRKPPSALHWFGTDELGRDILARVIYGARASLLAGAILGSGMYDLESRKPAPNILAYYGDDTAKFRERSPIYGLKLSRVPLLIFVSELDSADFHEQGLKLIQALFERDGTLPRFLRLHGHNHYSPTLHMNIGDDQDALTPPGGEAPDSR